MINATINDLTFGDLRALVEKIGGADIFRKLLRSSKINVTFNNGEAEIATASTPFPTWRTLTIGNTRKDCFCQRFKDNDLVLDDTSIDILEHKVFTTAKRESQINLIAVSLADLELEKNTRLDVFCQRAKKLGLELCPAEVGAQLRLQYIDQPLGERLYIAMRAIRIDDEPKIFSVANINYELRLCSSRGNPGNLVYPDSLFIFTLKPSDNC